MTKQQNVLRHSSRTATSVASRAVLSVTHDNQLTRGYCSLLTTRCFKRVVCRRFAAVLNRRVGRVLVTEAWLITTNGCATVAPVTQTQSSGGSRRVHTTALCAPQLQRHGTVRRATDLRLSSAQRDRCAFCLINSSFGHSVLLAVVLVVRSLWSFGQLHVRSQLAFSLVVTFWVGWLR